MLRTLIIHSNRQHCVLLQIVIVITVIFNKAERGEITNGCRLNNYWAAACPVSLVLCFGDINKLVQKATWMHWMTEKKQKELWYAVTTGPEMTLSSFTFALQHYNAIFLLQFSFLCFPIFLFPRVQPFVFSLSCFSLSRSPPSYFLYERKLIRKEVLCDVWL